MWSEKISISVQTEDKNGFIQNSDTEWMGFVDGAVSTEDEMRGLLTENPFLEEYDVLLFGDNVPEGECSLLELLASPECIVYALFFRRALLIHTGSFNDKLPGNDSYELLLRLAERGRVYSVPCAAEKEIEFYPVTMAYIIRRYMKRLKEYGILDELVLRMFQIAEIHQKSEAFKEAMGLFLEKEEAYEKIASDTAPILIMVSNDVPWYGVVDGFANSLADELVKLGQAVILTNGRYGEFDKISKTCLLSRIYKAVIGFQSPALQNGEMAAIKGAKYQFWLDDPMFYISFFKDTPKEMHVLCQDANYAEFLKEHFGLKNAIQFPPAGESAKSINSEKLYDLVFIGSYLPMPEADISDSFRQQFYQYMLEHVEATAEQGVRAVWQMQGVSYDEKLLLQTLDELKDVCYVLLHIYRRRVMEAILTAGIPVHVFGDSWRNYSGRGVENLIIHPKVMAKESPKVWSQAKIGLNIMNGHKAGMTERIANIMLCGACCLTDETSYLKEHFKDGENIVLFRADRPEHLVERILYLLQHDDERERIARAGREKALREHQWSVRARELLDLIQSERNGKGDEIQM